MQTPPVETYFNLRRLGADNGGGGSPADKPTGEDSTPPNKPAA